jgi:HK97 gp10 family phage protein
VVSIWFEGIEEMNTITASIEADKGGVGAKGSLVIRKYALQVEGTAKVFAPVDTGHLKGSIGPPTYEGDGRFGEITATITAAAAYAGYVEYGTRNMAPHAFMGPALDRHTPEYIEAVSRIGNPLGGGLAARARRG